MNLPAEGVSSSSRRPGRQGAGDLSGKAKTALVMSGVFALSGVLMLVAFNLSGWWFPPWVVAAMFALSAALVAHHLLGGLSASRFSTAAFQLAGGFAALVVIWFTGDRSLQAQLKPDNSRKAQQSEIATLKGVKQAIQGEIDHERQRLARLRQMNPPDDSTEPKPDSEKGSVALDDMVARLDPEPAEAARIRELATRHLGPWAPTSRQADYTLSVAGKQRGRVASACDELKFGGEAIELSSLLVKGDDSYGSEKPVRVDSWKTLNPAVCDRFQIQVSCEIALELFTADVINCDANGGFTWVAGFGGLIPVRGAVVVD